MRLRLAIVEDRPDRVRTLVELFGAQGFDVVCVAHTLHEARRFGIAEMADAVIVDRDLPDGDGMAYAAALREQTTDLAVFVFSDGVPPPLLPHGIHYLHNDAVMQWPGRMLAIM